MLEAGAKYSEAIAVVRLGSLFGLKEPRYIATLGGLLFINADFSEASGVFEESKKQEFSASEANQIHYWAVDRTDRTKRLRVQGKVMAVRAGFCLIDVANYPRLLCPGTRWGGMLMRVGQEVTIEIGFCAKGPIADHPMPA
jgi:hypothetical protein